MARREGTNGGFTLLECTTAEEFWEQLSPEKAIRRDGSGFIYRGQGKAEWKLLPRVFRETKCNLFNIQGRPPATSDEQVASELIILNRFVEECDLVGLRVPHDSRLFRNQHLDFGRGSDKYFIDPSQWPNVELIELMALAQHHGVPTRLLDWSRRSYVAAYFAASTSVAGPVMSNQAKIAVWALDSIKGTTCENVEIVTGIPGYTSENLAAQSGLFTLLKQPEDKRRRRFQPRSLEDEFLSLPESPLRKITLPAQSAPRVLELCRLYGVSASTLFPGYDGAARAISDWLNSIKASD
jgi:hypothetical protein